MHLRGVPVEGRERGIIINVSSVAGIQGQRGHLAYSASKAAVRGMILPMARDLGRLKIRVLAIAPGVINTPMTNSRGDRSKSAIEFVLSQCPTGEIATKEDFANLVKGVIENEYLNATTIEFAGGAINPHI